MLIPITGGAYKHASQDVNCQRCVNMYPTEIGPNGNGMDDPNNAPDHEGVGKGALMRSPGCKLLIDLGGQQCRGLFTINNQYVYTVVDEKLYQLVVNDLTKTATSTFIGSLDTFTGPVHMRNNINQLLIVDGSTSAYIYMAKTFGTSTPGPIGGDAPNATFVAASQAVLGSSFLTLTAGAADINEFGAPLIFTATGNASARTATIVGVDNLGAQVTEVITLPNTSTVTSTKQYVSVQSIAISGAITGNLSVGAVSSYYLSINGSVIYNAVDATIALTVDQCITKINTFTTDTTITASSGGTGVINLTAEGPITITIVEGGFNFTQGTDGITISTGNFSTGTVTAYQTIGSEQNYVGGSTVVFNDGYFLYNQPDTNYVWSSALNDGTSWSALEFFTAETKPCIVEGLAVNKGEVWLLADTLTEVWFDAANPPPGSPYSYRVGSGMDIGCQAPNSIVEMELINIWLDSRGYVSVSDISPYIRNNNSGYSMKVVSTPALHAEWATYPTLTDAIGTYYVDRGHIMYMLTFPTAQKTWVYDFPSKQAVMSMTVGEWHERTYLNPGSFQEEYYLIQYVTKFNQLNIGAGIRSGKIYDFGFGYFTDDGAPIRCTRTTAPFSADFKYVGVDKLSLRMETGLSLQQGSGSMPQVMLRYSNDGAHTWSQSLARDMGKVGEYNHKLTWNRLGSADEWVFEFTIQSPIEFSLIKAGAEVTNVEGEW